MSVFDGLTRMRLDQYATDDIRLNGKPLSHWGLDPATGWLTIEQPELATSQTITPGHAGATDQTLTDSQGHAYPGNRKIILPTVISGDEWAAIDTKQRIGSLIGSICAITWRELPGTFKGRLTIDGWADTGIGPDYAQSTTTITIDATPYVIGPPRSLSLPSGGSWVRVSGNRESWPTFTLTPLGGVSSVTVACGDRHVTVAPGGVVTGGVVLDCAKRVARANGNVMPVTLDSDWFPLTPGATRVTLTGCSGSVSYTPMTMI